MYNKKHGIVALMKRMDELFCHIAMQAFHIDNINLKHRII